MAPVTLRLVQFPSDAEFGRLFINVGEDDSTAENIVRLLPDHMMANDHIGPGESAIGIHIPRSAIGPEIWAKVQQEVDVFTAKNPDMGYDRHELAEVFLKKNLNELADKIAQIYFQRPKLAQAYVKPGEEPRDLPFGVKLATINKSVFPHETVEAGIVVCGKAANHPHWRGQTYDA